MDILIIGKANSPQKSNSPKLDHQEPEAPQIDDRDRKIDDQKKDDRKQIGANGESFVCAYLERQGWEILARNFRCTRGEIDLIALEPTASGKPVLVFIEVKTRRSIRYGSPVEAVDIRKQRKLTAVAQTYLGERGGEEPACRFDVAEVFLERGQVMRVQLYKGFFETE